MEKELFLLTEKAAGTEGQRQITAVVSSEIIDRDGDIVLASAVKNAMPTYMANPVILASHTPKLNDGTPAVIGKVVKWWQEGKKTLCTIEFTPTPLGDQYLAAYSVKYQRAFSIGFREIKSEIRIIKEKSVRVIVEIEIYEISACAIPANQDSLSKSAKRRVDFVASKRSGIGSDEPDYEFEIAALEKYEDFQEGKLDGISAKELKYLEDMNRKAIEFAEYLDSPECDALYGNDEDLSKSAPGGSVEADYFPVEKGAFERELYTEAVSKAVGDDADNEPDYF